MDIPPQQGHDRSRRTLVDEKAISTPHAPLSQTEPQVQPEFQALPMPQPGLYPPMTPKAYQAFMNFWYAQAQAQTQMGQTQYPVPPTMTFTQHAAPQQGVKLSKLVKEARQLGYETFSGIVDAVVARNWLKKVSDTLIDMELNDELKLRVATRLIDKSAATWWDNLKL